ncbi:MAG: ROK family protein [Ruminococcaceae bacterium]|nr:ROK family protein [Oscillospiraceae bacterium]
MYIGIDLGGTNIAAGVVDEKGNILATDSTPTEKERDFTEIVADMAEIAKKVTRKAGLATADIKGVGIGCPGTVDNKNGMVVYANNLKMEHSPVAAEFKKHWDIPVSLINDADAAAFGEFKMTAPDADSFVFMTLGTGVGGGVVIDGKLMRGCNGAGGELGHFCIEVDGKPCTCGARGCLESYASVTALIEQTKEKMAACPDSNMHDWVKKKGKISGRTAFECAKQGDAAAIEVRDRYIHYVAVGVNSLINIFQPKIFAIGGGISREGDTLLDPIKAFVKKNNYNKYMNETELRIATLFNDAGIIGAAFAAMTKQ